MSDKGCGEQLLVISTTCVAVIEEEWILKVPATVAMRATASDHEALALLNSDFVISVGTANTRSEHGRSILGVECFEDPSRSGM